MVHLKSENTVPQRHELWLDTAADIDFDEAQRDERALMWALGWGLVIFFAVGLAWLMLPMIMAGMKGGYL